MPPSKGCISLPPLLPLPSAYVGQLGGPEVCAPTSVTERPRNVGSQTDFPETDKPDHREGFNLLPAHYASSALTGFRPAAVACQLGGNFDRFQGL